MSHENRDIPEPGARAEPPATPKRRPPTSVDVARRAGVSQATVSYVLNGLPDSRVRAETRARVLAAADELGYTAHAMARSLRAGQSDIILFPQLSLPTGPMITRFYEGLAARLGALGYTFITHLDPAARGVEAARVWASLRPVGLLVEAARVSRRSIELLRIAGTRAIIVMGESPSRLAPTLVNNDSDVGACAGEHLIASGHQHLAVVVPREVGLVRLGLERLKGIERVARAYTIPVERVDLAYDEAEAARLAARWKQAPHPTGVFAYNDDYAMLMMRALLDADFAIPGDIALVGADNLPYCTLLRPRLTSVHKEDAAGIDAAAETFHALIEGTRTDIPPIQLLRPRIVIRESA
jgi:DNA-binding LacI/PurR family transcriptional regulator